jgi:hypothetical protein
MGSRFYGVRRDRFTVVTLEAFFQLYHLIEFDYVVNLSPEHYPLKSTNAIYHFLEVGSV